MKRPAPWPAPRVPGPLSPAHMDEYIARVFPRDPAAEEFERLLVVAEIERKIAETKARLEVLYEELERTKPRRTSP
jgi:hypothetical protein